MRSRSPGVITRCRSVPSSTRSMAWKKSCDETVVLPCLAAPRAASFARLRRSAPTRPGVAAGVSSGGACGGGGDPVGVAARRQRHFRGVDLEDRGAPAPVWWLQRHPPVEPAGPEQSLVEDIRPVGGRQDDHSLHWLGPLHLREDLVQRLFLLVVAAEANPRGTAAPDRIELVDEDDRGGCLSCFGEQITYAGCTDADDRFDELRCGLAEEWNLRLPRHRAGEQRLAGARRPDQKDAFRDHATESLVLLWLAQEVD